VPGMGLNAIEVGSSVVVVRIRRIGIAQDEAHHHATHAVRYKDEITSSVSDELVDLRGHIHGAVPVVLAPVVEHDLVRDGVVARCRPDHIRRPVVVDDLRAAVGGHAIGFSMNEHERCLGGSARATAEPEAKPHRY